MFDDSDLADAAATLRSGPDALYELLAQRLKRRPGFDLLTVLAPNDAGDRLIRLYSSNHNQYPLGDADIVQDDMWFRQLFSAKEAVVANDANEIRHWLPDFVEYVEMGYGSLLNLPIVISGEAIGIMNVMAREGHFSAEAVRAIGDQTPLAALAVLARDAGQRRLAFR
jgi:GAF domain-containing protein